MKQTDMSRLLIVYQQGTCVPSGEIDALGDGYSSVSTIEIVPRRSPRGLLRRVVSNPAKTLHRKEIESRIRKEAGGDRTDILVYGDGLELDAVASVAEKDSGVRFIIRYSARRIEMNPHLGNAAGIIVDSDVVARRLSIAIPSLGHLVRSVHTGVIPSVGAVVPHSVSDKGVTFVSGFEPELSYRLVRSIAVARPSTRVEWLCHEGEMPDTVTGNPDNLSVGTYSNMSEVIASRPVDWIMMMKETPGCVPGPLLNALSFGIPVIAVASPSVSEVIDDDCGVLFGPNPQTEEFVRGMLPFLESDIRRDMLREGMRVRQQEMFDYRQVFPGFAAVARELFDRSR